MGFVPRDTLLILFAAFTALAGLFSLKANTWETAEAQRHTGASGSAWGWAVSTVISAGCWAWAEVF